MAERPALAVILDAGPGRRKVEPYPAQPVQWSAAAGLRACFGPKQPYQITQAAATAITPSAATPNGQARA